MQQASDCAVAIADRLRRPLAQIAPAWPLPAGGMQYERIGELVEFYGRDAMLLIGGALLRDEAPLAKSTERFREAIERATR